MDTILIAMSSVGLSLSTSERQGVIDMLAASGDWPNEVRDAVKALGGTYKPRWQSEGYAVEPTLESVQAEIDKEIALQAYRDMHSKHFVPVLDGELTIDNLITAAQAMADELGEL
jgi:hypothetical protein